MKNRTKLTIIIILGEILASPIPGHAAGPYVVDDAGIVEPDKIQSESWYSHTDRHEDSGTANLAYQLLKNTEFTMEETHDDMRGTQSDTVSPQVKYVWREGDDAGRIAGSLVLGTEYAVGQAHALSPYAYIPFTLQVNEVLSMNINIGWQYVTPTKQNFATWGIGGEYQITPTFSVISDVFGRNDESPGVQIGPRITFSDNLALDLIYGHNVTGLSENVATVGLTLTM